MRAANCDGYGSIDAVRLIEVPDPVPGPGDVLVRVRAASVNRADLDGIHPRPQFARLFMGVRRPKVTRVGLDVAGVVEAIGSEVTAFQPGDQVFGDLSAFGQGAFAELVCAPERAFSAMPESLSFEEAATLPHAGVLALQGLRLRGGRTIAAGDRVLIVGASGNVGPFAVQIAASRGAEVTGVCSGSKMDFVRSLGASNVLDYRAVDWTATADRYDWIMDTDSHQSVFRVRRALVPDGVYVTLGGSDARLIQGMTVAPVMTKAGRRWLGLLLWWKPMAPDDVAALKALVAAGTVKPAIDRRFTLDEVVPALRYVDDGKPHGKVVITV